MTYGNYPDLSSVKKVLIIKLRHLGDVLLSTPLIHCVKEALPNARIDVYVYEEAKDILSSNGDIHKIITYDRKWKKLSFFRKIVKEAKILFSIKKQKYDLVINLTEGDRGAIVAKISGAPLRVGFDPKGKGFFKKKSIFTHIVKAPSTPRHTVERDLDALRVLGIFPVESQKKMRFLPMEEDRKFVLALLDSLPLDKKQYIVMHPTSRWLFKSWPVEKFQELGRYLTQSGNYLLITGGNAPNEKEFIKSIKEGIVSEKVFDMSGRLTLGQLGALIEMSKLIITVDSLPLHLSAALNVPTIALFGPTCEKTWGPWMNEKAIVLSCALSCRPCHLDGCGGSKMSDCLQQLTARAVEKACSLLLEKGE